MISDGKGNLQLGSVISQVPPDIVRNIDVLDPIQSVAKFVLTSKVMFTTLNYFWANR